MGLREDLKPYINYGHSIAYDGCHKIYINMDARETGKMENFRYGMDDDDSQLIIIESVDDAIDTVVEWYENSCSLRLIAACSSQVGRDNYIQVRSQFEDESEGDNE